MTEGGLLETSNRERNNAGTENSMSECEARKVPILHKHQKPRRGWQCICAKPGRAQSGYDPVNEETLCLASSEADKLEKVELDKKSFDLPIHELSLATVKSPPKCCPVRKVPARENHLGEPRILAQMVEWSPVELQGNQCAGKEDSNPESK
ncbi:uncharacterized protein PHALS_05557 [Plasmopara halstedii]|uniref:Uncharacterized protein n=1 Tax=Plasmopara halstedii TaxID=4781 RepID=A0A0P1B064_PLAHL|nr:uncharacterized protein PHALS_05557 [Plasmopara halstedii]CEG48081.1 hypothetical protein PHALS_05557 [Plasmopara halstedii]|eukprot:XP_024584450.1 hypothetical protein PHALS_05557 [Plasmopara halstedii]